MFLRRELRVWDDLDVEVRLLTSSLSCGRLTMSTVLHDVHGVAHEVHRYTLRVSREAAGGIFGH